jgi:hypothetical protein
MRFDMNTDKKILIAGLSLIAIITAACSDKASQPINNVSGGPPSQSPSTTHTAQS